MPGDENKIVWSRQLADKLQQYKRLNHRLAVDNGYLLAENNELKTKINLCAACQTKLAATTPPPPTRSQVQMPASPFPSPPSGFKQSSASFSYNAPNDKTKLAPLSNKKHHALPPIIESASPVPPSYESTTSPNTPFPSISESVSTVKHNAAYSPTIESSTNNRSTPCASVSESTTTKHTTHSHVSKSDLTPTTPNNNNTTTCPPIHASTSSAIKPPTRPPHSQSTIFIKAPHYKRTRAIATIVESDRDMELRIPAGADDSSDTSSFILPSKRTRRPVNYVLPSLKKKLRKGDQFACNSHPADKNDLSPSWQRFQVIARNTSRIDSPILSPPHQATTKGKEATSSKAPQ